jgi:putative GTP pyrophosphokinase
VEVQIRTIAMDFWASLEHKIYYKYKSSVPVRLLQELKEAADSAAALDQQMERLHKEISEIKENNDGLADDGTKRIIIRDQEFQIPAALLELIDYGGQGNE